MRRRPVFIGVDIGGSKVLALATDASLTPLAVAERKHPVRRDRDTVVATTRELVREVVRSLPQAPSPHVKSVGVAFPGFLEAYGRKVLRAPNLPGWDGTDAREIFSNALRFPVALENDANAAAWAEYSLTDHGDSQDLLYVILGTGVGGGLVLRGSLFRGPHGTAGEIGHMATRFSRRRCGCGRVGCLETLAGGKGLAQTGKRLAARHPRSLLARRWRSTETPGARELLFAAEEGDPYAREARDLAGDEVGRAIAASVNLLGVERVVLGGRLLRNAPGYFQAIRGGLERHVLSVLQKKVHLQQSHDLHHAVAMGALLVARHAAGDRVFKPPRR